ncbi:MAG: glycosyltransferase family 39 protein [Candidatus Hydrogenedentes bacterium]|nr:glycosyltransferase family 39 protein [Candidatus Hydrogenedentota bacterium]
MSVEAFVQNDSRHLERRLTSIYSRCLAWYLLAVAILWLTGIEGIYSHPTPFYAYLMPAFTTILIPAAVLALMWLAYLIWQNALFPLSPRRKGLTAAGVALWVAAVGLIGWGVWRQAGAEGQSVAAVLAEVWRSLRWHLLALAVFLASLGGWWWAMTHVPWFENELPKRARRWMLTGLIAFSIVFPCSVAMIRDGAAGITAAYDRYQHEYVNDIGQGGSIRGLFRDYVKMHPYLSTHAKVHPPGPIVILWILSFIAGRGALGLSLATIAFGSLAIIPLYFWARDLTNTRTALTCCFLYALMPSIVLFTATSADITFMPFTLTTLFLFWRAIHRRSVLYAAAAGALYAVLSLISFSLIGLGALFALVGLWRLRAPGLRLSVVQTALVMAAAFLLTHLAIRLWTGFDVIACFHACKAQFDQDQLNLDIFAPRYPGWVYRFFNPACWLFFAGIPVSVLFIWRLARPDADTKALFLVFAGTLIVLDILYLARGEGERSAMYILPFMALPAAHLLDRIGLAARSCRPMLVTFAFLAVQTWLIETWLYTYW